MKLLRGMSGAPEWEGRLHRGFGEGARFSRERRLAGGEVGIQARDEGTAVVLCWMMNRNLGNPLAKHPAFF